MLDHVSIGVSDIERSKAFYDQALKPLGIEHLYIEDGFGYGQDRKAYFWIGFREAVLTGSHIAFAAKDRAMLIRKSIANSILTSSTRASGESTLETTGMITSPESRAI